MTVSRYVTARTRFEAARQLSQLPAERPEHGLHGHGFDARVCVATRQLGAPAGLEVQALREALAQAVQPLHYGDLNRVLEQPDDLHLARLLRERLSCIDAAAEVQLLSTPTQGAGAAAGDAGTVMRRYRFLAAHFLPNVPAGHKCGRLHGHGFEVELCAGLADPAALDAHWQPLAQVLDHTLLNDLDGLANPTSEMLAAWIWRRLRPALAQLRGVSVFETGSSGARFDGADYRIWKEFGLDSAVQVRRAPAGSAPARLHGQTFRLRLSLRAPLDHVLGWVVDFGDVKSLFRPLFERLDHQPLHQLEGLADSDTCTLADWVYDACRAQLPQLCGVQLLESDGCGAGVERAD